MSIENIIKQENFFIKELSDVINNIISSDYETYNIIEDKVNEVIHLFSNSKEDPKWYQYDTPQFHEIERLKYCLISFIDILYVPNENKEKYFNEWKVYSKKVVSETLNESVENFEKNKSFFDFEFCYKFYFNKFFLNLL